MASSTKKTKIIRKKKKANAGKVRKAKNRNQGTTLTKTELFGDE